VDVHFLGGANGGHGCHCQIVDVSSIGKSKSMSDSLHLPLIIETDEDGVFIISCPAFKGCHSYGNTIDIREAIDLCLEEEQPKMLNRLVGFREIEVPYSRIAS